MQCFRSSIPRFSPGDAPCALLVVIAKPIWVGNRDAWTLMLGLSRCRVHNLFVVERVWRSLEILVAMGKNLTLFIMFFIANLVPFTCSILGYRLQNINTNPFRDWAWWSVTENVQNLHWILKRIFVFIFLNVSAFVRFNFTLHIRPTILLVPSTTAIFVVRMACLSSKLSSMLLVSMPLEMTLQGRWTSHSGAIKAGIMTWSSFSLEMCPLPKVKRKLGKKSAWA